MRHALLTLFAFEPKSKADNKPTETAALKAIHEM
jgi:hypothetical protein